MVEHSLVISKVMDIGLNRINNHPDIDIDEIFKTAANGEERTVKIVIYKDPEDGENPTKTVFKDNTKIIWQQGLAHKDGMIVKFNSGTPTVIYKITVSAWFRLIAQQNTFTDLYWSDKLDASGQYFYRDLVVWNKFWQKYKDVVKLSTLEKLLVKDKKPEVY